MTVHHAPGDPFTVLRQDWGRTCRRYRRSDLMYRWAQKEPDLTGYRTLAEIIPPAGSTTDQTPICSALARLHRDGDDIAQRALLQLLLPGMILVAARWRTWFEDRSYGAAWDVVSRASLYIGKLRHRSMPDKPAAYILRSVHRDLVEAVATVPVEQPLGDHDQTLEDDARLALPSAEDALCAGPVVRSALEDAARCNVLPEHAVETVWLILNGFTVPAAAQRTFQAPKTAYRYRDRAYQHLRQQLDLRPGAQS